jgi:hypothetical protein
VAVVFYAFYAVVVFLSFGLVGATVGYVACLLVHIGERLLLAATVPLAFAWWVWAGWLEPTSKDISHAGWLVYVSISSAGFVGGSRTGRRAAARSRAAVARARRGVDPPDPEVSP